MHSFHQSRGRIYFDIFCALTIAASCAVAWLQTGASAFLAVAGVVALYSLVRATDVRRRSAAVAAELPVSQPSAEGQGKLLSDVENLDVAPAEAPKPAPTAKRRSRKKQAALETAADPTKAIPQAEEPVTDVSQPVEAIEAVEADDDYQPVLAPLFEPEPFVRMPRPAFGRKAG